MKNAAVICEFDPLHTGHEYLIKSLRDKGAERVVCIMSGDACQRGELSTFSKHTRARAALASGADLVLELPFPYSSASAEYFAFGAVSIIKALGCIDTLGFGCETGDSSVLEKTADILCSDEFEREFARLRMSEPDIGAAAGMARALDSLGEDSEILSGANNTLAIEYIKSAKKLGVPLSLFAVKRQGAGHGDEASGGFSSASHLRKSIFEGRLLREYLPESCADLFDDAIKCADISMGLSFIGESVLSHFRLMSEHSPETASGAGGLINRMRTVSHAARDYDSFVLGIKTKKYTDARLRRAVIFSMCSVIESDLKASPEYTTLLGASKDGIALLSEIKKTLGIQIVSNPAMLRALPASADRQKLLSYRIAALRALTKKVPTETEADLKLPPVITGSD